jgi:AmmeMemoRadiSam system protein B/AmmeMemoRadiSam system protein A
LLHLVEGLLTNATRARTVAGKDRDRGALRAIVVPHAALAYSGETAALGWALARSGSFERVIVLAPNHRVAVRGAAVDPSTHYDTPLGRVEVDLEATALLAAEPSFAADPKPFVPEHAIEMQLPFLQVVLPQAKLVPVLIGDARPASSATITHAIAQLLDLRTLVVVSSDFTHYGTGYGYVPFRDRVPERIEALDHETIEALVMLDRERFRAHLETTGTTVCGRRPLATLLDLAPHTWQAELLGYTTSGAVTGDYEHSVSYAAIAYALARRAEDPQDGAPSATAEKDPAHLSVPERRMILFAARQALEALFAPPEIEARLAAISLTPNLSRPAGVFVSLHRRKGGRLRGCIGSLQPRLPLVEAVVEEARNAATRDPRFPAVRAEELDGLEIEVSVLGPVVAVHDIDEIVIGRDGLLVTLGAQRGVLLPQVAEEQRWTREQFLTNTCLKAELPANAWQSGAMVERFAAQVFGES